MYFHSGGGVHARDRCAAVGGRGGSAAGGRRAWGLAQLLVAANKRSCSPFSTTPPSMRTKESEPTPLATSCPPAHPAISHMFTRPPTHLQRAQRVVQPRLKLIGGRQVYHALPRQLNHARALLGRNRAAHSSWPERVQHDHARKAVPRSVVPSLSSWPTVCVRERGEREIRQGRVSRPRAGGQAASATGKGGAHCARSLVRGGSSPGAPSPGWAASPHPTAAAWRCARRRGSPRPPSSRSGRCRAG